MGDEFVQLSLTPLIIGIAASVACALPGNFLILRRQALIGDAISHVVLPGIVVAFLITGTVTAWPMLFGAAAASILAVVMIEAIKRLGRIEPGAAMGVTFTALFAAGAPGVVLALVIRATIREPVRGANEGERSDEPAPPVPVPSVPVQATSTAVSSPGYSPCCW